MSDEIQKIPKIPNPSGKSAVDGEPEDLIQIGQWYWVKNQKDKDPWFGCVVHVGTNYAEVQAPRYGSSRIHFDNFFSICSLEPNPDAVIDKEISEHQTEVNRLLGRVKEVTAQLSIVPNPLLQSGNETRALALRGPGQDMGEYGKALEKAKKEILPDLFRRIQSTNESLAAWMTAKIVPLKAQAKGLDSIIGAINERIFSVELYAGLTENVEKIRDGEPAPLSTKVHLFQRRCYMDEECLAHYETGGISFRNIHEFDNWIAREDNLNRLFPFPRSIVAFRVRRSEKHREIINFSDFISLEGELNADKWTFLYIRNGAQLFRMDTKIEFGHKLFPDLGHNSLVGKLWAEMFAGNVKRLITDNEHTGIIEDLERERKEWRKKDKAFQQAKKAGKKTSDDAEVNWPGFEPRLFHDYEPYDRSSVYKDDIAEKIQDEIREHNRIGLVIQGLLDRSPVLHPHPPWQIWTPDGFNMALELVYDESRTLTTGEAPDFEAYRARLNQSLKTGSVTVGQQEAWLRYEAKKESDRRDRDYRYAREHYRPSHFQPHGNPGPGILAKVMNFNKNTKECSYSWNRERQTHPNYGSPIRTTFSCVSGIVLNVDAYTPGDFKIFFNDPRTRADYLQWAPLLLEAEEYHAGNRKVVEPAPPGPKIESSWEGQKRYENRKIRKQLMGKAVRLVRDVKMMDGTVYKSGSLWRVIGGSGRDFEIEGIETDGTPSKKSRGIRKMRAHDFEVDPDIPEK